ncbi:cytochrome D1 domain-containing protein [Sphaerotilus mobilis]|uniref:YVTN family beta-propeller protein n=1 Tax=Sphaerotilus mobilis TaxID=47994 RepID=A0A4Q7LSY7_9BURK|nr:cytochrome D1 domain-containing protein [Sphaerotilus mobilis]RZS58025.1 YVTN family beta-propeller protein [Sphaerotilus mobilis]
MQAAISGLIRSAALIAVFAMSSAQAGDDLPVVQQHTQGGVKAELNLNAEQTGAIPLGQPLTLTLTLTDELSGTPLRGLRPRMWMSRQGGDQAEPCTAQIRRFASGRLAQRADRDLNSFQLLTLNADASISVINPLLQLNNTKLEALIRLPGVGTDWVHARGLDRLFVTLADRAELAVVDLANNKLIKTVSLGEGKPRRLVIGPDERTVWVALDDSDRLVGVDVATMAVSQELKIGDGAHALSLSEDGRRLVVTSTAANQVSLIDAQAGKVLARVPVSGTPLAVTHSALARRAYIGSLNAPLLTVIDLDNGQPIERITLPQPVSAVRADPSGRHVLAVHTASSTLMAIDAASARLVAQASVVAQPDQIAYTQRFAFIRGLGSSNVQMVELRALDDGKLALNELPVFQKPPAEMPEHIGPADLMVTTPEPGTMLLGSAPDTALYYYAEGMMAPQGTYATYRRAARAVKVVDRSLKETAPGVYTGLVRLDRGGLYTLPTLLEQPRLTHCYAFNVDETGATTDGRRIDVTWQIGDLSFSGSSARIASQTLPGSVRDAGKPGQAPRAEMRTGQASELAIRLKDGQTGQPLSGIADLQVMALERPGLSQQRAFAKEREAGSGVYVVTQTFPREGVWRVMVQSRSLGLTFDRSPLLDIGVRKTEPVANAATGR